MATKHQPLTPIPEVKDNTVAEEAEIQAQIAEDPDDSEISGSALPIKRGRPAGPTKESVTIRIDKDVLAALRSPDPKGWQTRLNVALRRGLEL